MSDDRLADRVQKLLNLHADERADISGGRNAVDSNRALHE